MNTNSDFVMPAGQINTTVDLSSVGGNQREKRNDVQKLVHGLNLGVIYGFVDLGTHLVSFEGKPPTKKRQMKLLFEHPQLKQLFYVDDTVPRSTGSSKDCTLSINEKSFLKQVIDAVEGRVTTIKEAQSYNVMNLLGKKVGVNIVHQPKKTDQTVFYEKVVGVINPNGLAVPHPFEPENKSLFFFIDPAGNNFRTQNFADLPKYYRDEIMKSDEAIAYKGRGGQFAENPQQNNQGQQQQAQPQQGTQTQFAQQQSQQFAAQPQQAAAPQAQASPIIMSPNETFTREQYLAVQGWSDELLVAQGKATWAPGYGPQAQMQQQTVAQPQQQVVQQPQQQQMAQQPQQAVQQQPAQSFQQQPAATNFLTNPEPESDLPF